MAGELIEGKDFEQVAATAEQAAQGHADAIHADVRRDYANVERASPRRKGNCIRLNGSVAVRPVRAAQLAHWQRPSKLPPLVERQRRGVEDNGDTQRACAAE